MSSNPHVTVSLNPLAGDVRSQPSYEASFTPLQPPPQAPQAEPVRGERAPRERQHELGSYRHGNKVKGISTLIGGSAGLAGAIYGIQSGSVDAGTAAFAMGGAAAIGAGLGNAAGRGINYARNLYTGGHRIGYVTGRPADEGTELVRQEHVEMGFPIVGDVPSFKRGGNVRETGLAYLHKGEYVVPKNKVNLIKKDLKIK